MLHPLYITISDGTRFAEHMLEYNTFSTIWDEAFFKKTWKFFAIVSSFLRGYSTHPLQCFVEGHQPTPFWNTYLTHLFPMCPFFTPWKHQKTLRFYVFRGKRKGALVTNGLSKSLTLILMLHKNVTNLLIFATPL